MSEPLPNQTDAVPGYAEPSCLADVAGPRGCSYPHCENRTRYWTTIGGLDYCESCAEKVKAEGEVGETFKPLVGSG